MTQPAQAFGPGSPSVAGAMVAQTMGTVATGGIPLPPVNLASRSGDIGQTQGFDFSGFNVNFGTALGQGGSGAALPWWVWAGALVLGLAWVKKKGG